jgi:GNAT superfamily N-acetyltransferase
VSAALVETVSTANLSSFVLLLQAIEREIATSDLAAERAASGIRASLARYDFTRSDSCWMLLATVEAAPAGYASAVRIPKADARAGFLFVDELYVLRPFRRAGIARVLLDYVERFALGLGLAGVRLFVRPENAAARSLYRVSGYAESPTIFCEKRF